MNIFRRLGWFFKERKGHYIFGVSMLALIAVLQLLPPRIIGSTVDAILTDTLTKEVLFRWLFILVVAGIFMYVARYFWRLMIFGSAVYLGRTLRANIYRHLTEMSASFYQKRRVGDLMAHATNDINAVQQTAGMGVLTLVDSLVTGSIVILTMGLTISWKLTFIALIPLPFMIILTSYYGRLLRERFKYAQESFSDLNDKTQESIAGIEVIKTFGQQKEDVDEFHRLSDEVVAKNMRVARVDALFDPTIQGIFAVSFILSFIFGTKFILAGDMTVGDLIAFSSYLSLLIWPLLAFGFLFNIVERGNASYTRIEELLSVAPEITDRKGALDEAPTGDLSFHIDAFAYPGEKEAALRDVHFDLARGETLGIVGATGSGKTTILKLLMREFEGYKGRITFGGHDIRAYRQKRLLESIGLVPQEHFLFSTTIRENIAFTDPTVSDDVVFEAAKRANIHDDILRLTEGYDTLVGERGVSLSGGQKQRVSIARALIMNPELLILDDSLSAVDAQTEATILQNLKEVRQDETTIITSHRLSAIAHADLILVMDEGTVVESGTHETLLAQRGMYYDMFMRQQLEEDVAQGGGAE